MQKIFTFTMPLSKTSLWAGQIRIKGTYFFKDGELRVEVASVYHSKELNPMPEDWTYIPHTFWIWLENGSDRIGEIAYEHCKGLLPQPDMGDYSHLKNTLS